MNLLVNGNDLQVPSDVNTIADVITHFFEQDPIVIVEHNGEILEKNHHTERIVADGDKIELVQFVGGG
ncbi:sulfur carrier protein ThiS [Oceanobacillus damuensis]|uniref:sulfur carrier protein ThiS n=1 Tax=Oceanobacillus damuensis TaxID=937928 RepID=UPI00082FF347|nr:sulfur carrier protein ThiS [Oceanobacillus damuensis]